MKLAIGAMTFGPRVRLNLDLIVIVFNDNGFGMIRMKQMADGYGNFGVEFNNPDLVKYAESFGAHGHRLDDPSRFRALLDETDKGGVHVIDVPIDAQKNMMLLKEMKSVDCSSFAGS